MSTVVKASILQKKAENNHISIKAFLIYISFLFSLIHQKQILMKIYPSIFFLLNFCPLKKIYSGWLSRCRSTTFEARRTNHPNPRSAFLGYQALNPLRPKTLEASKRKRRCRKQIYTSWKSLATIFISWLTNFTMF